MPYLVAGIVLYLLWRHYAQREAAANGGGGGDQPAQPSNNGGGPTPTPPVAAGQWMPMTGSPLIATPGYTYRASAPAQGNLIMMLLPRELSDRGFTDVHIYPPGTAYPDDWPDSGTGNQLHIEATLPATAQQASLDFAGVTAWRWVPSATAAAAAAAGTVIQAVESVRQQVGQVMAAHPHPQNFGVFSGLVRRSPQGPR
jgi:hypothetical protein